MEGKKLSKSIISVIALVAGMLFASCTGDSPIDNNKTNWEIDPNVMSNKRCDMPLDEKTRSAADGLQIFYPAFTAEVVKYVDESFNIISKNVVTSPLSAEIVLGMVANTIDSEGQNQILKYLNVEDVATLNDLNNRILSFIPSADTRTLVRLANSLWYRDSYTLNPTFANAFKDSYQGVAFAENFFRSDFLIKKINQWGADNTNNLIKETIKEIDPYSHAILINALYFNALWAEDVIIKDGTCNQPFYGATATSNVATMKSYRDKFAYASDDNFELLSIPYGNGTYAFRVILPKKGLSLKEANSLLTPATINLLKNNQFKRLINFTLPKFDLSGNVALTEVFSKGELAGLFKEHNYNLFTKAFDGGLKMYQNATIKVNETGSEAAATTVGDIGITSIPIDPETPYLLEINRPFYFFIEETSSGTCLISGRIADL